MTLRPIGDIAAEIVADAEQKRSGMMTAEEIGTMSALVREVLERRGCKPGYIVIGHFYGEYGGPHWYAHVSLRGQSELAFNDQRNDCAALLTALKEWAEDYRSEQDRLADILGISQPQAAE